jgi:hypothetical protein
LSRFYEIGEQTEEKSAWKQREGFNLTYTFVDAIKSAFVLREESGILQHFARLLLGI